MLDRSQQIERLHYANTFDVHRPPFSELESRLQYLVDRFADLDRICGSTRLHPARDIYGSSPQIVGNLLFSDDARNDGSSMNTDAEGKRNAIFPFLCP